MDASVSLKIAETAELDGGCRAKVRGHGVGEVVALAPVVVCGGSDTVVARAAFQAAATAIWCLWSFSRLWVAVISRHSERAADLPRR